MEAILMKGGIQLCFCLTHNIVVQALIPTSNVLVDIDFAKVDLPQEQHAQVVGRGLVATEKMY